MGLLTVIRKNKLKEKEMRLLILGLDNAGKTTILKRLLGEDVFSISPTLGFNIRTLTHEPFKLNLWDVGGQRSIRSFWKNYYDATDGLVWVVDSTDTLRMEACRDALHDLLKEERLAGISVLILANKQDMPGALSADEIHSFLSIDLIVSHSVLILPCSAFTGENTQKGLDWMVKDIASRIYLFQ